MFILEPGLPTNVTMSVTSSSARVVWNAPRDPNGKILKYQYKFFATDMHSFQNATMLETKETTKFFDNLKVYTRYSLSVRVINNADYLSDWTPLITKYTDPRGNCICAVLSLSSVLLFILKCFYFEWRVLFKGLQHERKSVFSHFFFLV